MGFYCLELISKDGNGLKLEKVRPTLIRFLQKSLVSYFHSDLLYCLYYQNISRVNGVFLRFTQCLSSYFIRWFKQRRCLRSWQCCMIKVLVAEPRSKKEEWGWGVWNTAGISRGFAARGGSAAKSHSTSTQYRQLRRLAKAFLRDAMSTTSEPFLF